MAEMTWRRERRIEVYDMQTLLRSQNNVSATRRDRRRTYSLIDMDTEILVKGRAVKDGSILATSAGDGRRHG